MKSSALNAAVAAALSVGNLVAPALAQAAQAELRVQTPLEALAQDAAEYARQRNVSLSEAIRRLRAQEESVAATNRIQDIYKDRLAGISIEHQPDFRIVVLLTGDTPVPDESIVAGGMTVPILFRTGARATRAAAVAAMSDLQAGIRALVPDGSGTGYDQRTGEIVLLLRPSVAERLGEAEIDSQLETLTGIPFRIRVLDRPDADMAVEGGARVEGVDPANGRRYACTTGFVVTDGSRTGVVTAAHCPDSLSYRATDGRNEPLEFIGQWGARYQDVQVHVGGGLQDPYFYADTDKRRLRPVTSWRNRTSTRAGDAVCRRGETTGYSCSEVELTDYAPPGALCGGPCDPVWVMVTGPACRSGDSGGPVFSGTVAFGIVKGGNYSRTGACNFYYYMSTDFLPDGWRLLYR